MDAAAGARSHRSIRWLVLAFVGSLLITAGALIVVGGEAEAQESADAPAGDNAQPAGSTAEPSAYDAESQPAPESNSQPASEPAPTDTTTEPAPEPTPEPVPEATPEPAPEPVPEPVHEAAIKPALVALGSKLSHEPTLEESSERVVPADATATSQSSSPDNVAERLASGFALAVDTLVNSLSDRATQMAVRAFDVVSRLAQTVGGLLDGGARTPSPAPIPPDAPAAPPPVGPVPVGGSSPAGERFSGTSVRSIGAFENLSQQFGVFEVLSLPLLKDSERPWTWREPLRPSSMPRPPNERPG